jgi:hypothetical protein
MDIVITFIVIIGLYLLQRRTLVQGFVSGNNRVTENYFDILFSVHLFFWLIYLIYALVNRSDSGEYYRLTVETASWGELFQSGTLFVRFLCYPFSNILGLSYNSVMLIFAFLGFQGLLLFYLAAKENINNLPIIWGGMSLLELLFLLPNSHFWSASLGKGSLMTFGIGLTIYGLSRFNKRLPLLLLGAFLVYMGRSHMLLAIVIGIGLGLFFTQRGIKWYFRFPFLIISLVAFLLLSDSVVEQTGAESLNIFDSQRMTHRVRELGKSSSGVDIANYSQGFKLFTFLFRPLFIDSPGLLGLFSSLENAFLLFLAIRFIIFIPSFWRGSNGFHKSAVFVFLLAAISLAQISGNLGIAIRQKSQIMPLFFLFYAYAFSYRLKGNR